MKRASCCFCRQCMCGCPQAFLAQPPRGFYTSCMLLFCPLLPHVTSCCHRRGPAASRVGMARAGGAPMPPGWAPRHDACRRAGRVAPAGLAPLVARRRAFVGPAHRAVTTAASPRPRPRSRHGLLAHVERTKAATRAAGGAGARHGRHACLGPAPWEPRPLRKGGGGAGLEPVGAPEGGRALAPSRLPPRGPPAVGGPRPGWSPRGQGAPGQGGGLGAGARPGPAVRAGRGQGPAAGARAARQRGGSTRGTRRVGRGAPRKWTRGPPAGPPGRRPWGATRRGATRAAHGARGRGWGGPAPRRCGRGRPPGWPRRDAASRRGRGRRGRSGAPHAPRLPGAPGRGATARPAPGGASGAHAAGRRVNVHAWALPRGGWCRGGPPRPGAQGRAYA